MTAISKPHWRLAALINLAVLGSLAGQPAWSGPQTASAGAGSTVIVVDGDNNKIEVRRDDPQVIRLLKQLEKNDKDEAFWKGQLQRKDADNDTLRRELAQIKAQLAAEQARAVQTVVAANREARPTAVAQAALAGLEKGRAAPAEALLAERERAALERARRNETEAQAARREAADLARQQGALHFGRDAQAALAAYRRAASLEPDDQWTQIFIGDLTNVLGNTAEALRAYRQSLAIAQTLAGRDPANSEWQRDLSVSHERIGDSLAAQGDGPGALAAYRQSLAIRQTLAGRDPANSEWQRDLSVSHNKIGDSLAAQGDGPGALAAYRQSLAIRQTLAGRDPANSEWQRDLSVSHDRIGDSLAAQGDGPGALAAYRQSLAIRQTLAGCDPANSQWQRDLSVSHERIGNSLAAQGDGPGALAAYRQGLAIRQTLAGRDPANSQWQRDLIVSHVKLQEATGERAYARQALDIALAMQRKGTLQPVDAWMIEALQRRAGEKDPVK